MFDVCSRTRGIGAENMLTVRSVGKTPWPRHAVPQRSPVLAELPPERCRGHRSVGSSAMRSTGLAWRALQGLLGSGLPPVSCLRPPHPEQPARPKRFSYPCGHHRRPAPSRVRTRQAASRQKPSKAHSAVAAIAAAPSSCLPRGACS